MGSMVMRTPTGPAAPPDRLTLPGVCELAVGDDWERTASLEDAWRRPLVIRRLLVALVIGLAVHGAAVGLVAVRLLATAPWSVFGRGSPAVWMPIALPAAFLFALGLCLPALVFQVRFAGLRTPAAVVVARALRGMAMTAVLLVCALPVYVAIAMAGSLGIAGDDGFIVHLGVAAPFGVGVAGIRDVYRSFRDPGAGTKPAPGRRSAWLRRAAIVWGVAVLLVAAVALGRLAEWFAGPPACGVVH